MNAETKAQIDKILDNPIAQRAIAIAAEEGAKKFIEELWKFCLENGAEQHGDLLALPSDPFFPLKLIKKIAEMHIGVRK